MINVSKTDFRNDGIRGNILQWFKSYLTNRSQYVTYDGTQSTTRYITCGVPQGSILGPLLFVIYMNDISNVSELLFTVLYADDTCVLINGADLDNIVKILNNELKLLSIWLKANKLSLNASKTYHMIFHRARIKIPNDGSAVSINNCIIEQSECLKYLGVILDSKISWIPHTLRMLKTKYQKVLESCTKQGNT